MIPGGSGGTGLVLHLLAKHFDLSSEVFQRAVHIAEWNMSAIHVATKRKAEVIPSHLSHQSHFTISSEKTVFLKS